MQTSSPSHARLSGPLRGALRFALLGALLGAAGCPGRTALDDRDGIDAGTGSGTDGGVAPTSCEATFTLSGFAGAGQVWLTGSFTDWAESPAAGAVVLERVGDVFTTTLTLDPGRYLYKFVVDGANWIADPSNPIGEPDGFGGQNSVYSCALALCGDADAFDWRDAVMYFAMVDRFYDSDGQAQPVPGATDGDATVGSSGQYEGGDLRGVAQKVPYLADLGVTALWLSAPYENRNETGIGLSDGYQYSGYHGYWPSPANIDYSNFANPSPRPRVESRIGSEADLRALIDSAHGASSANGDGIKMLFDYVMNHVDGNSGLFAAHPDWVAYDNGNIRLCGSDCGGGQCWDDSYWGTRCAFTDYLPPLDYGNLEARAWSIDDAMWWAQEYGIDGYRLDAIKHVPLEWLTELRARLNADVSDPPGGRFYLVGETFDYFNRDLLKRFVDPDTMLDGQFDFPFKREVCEGVFNPFGDLRALASFMDGNDRFYDSATRRAIMSTWIGNHDVPRPIHFADWRFGNCTEGSHGGNSWAAGQFPQPSGPEPYERLAVSFAVMMTNPGVPLIYYGDEIGLAGGGDPDNRRMMPWNDNALNPHQRALRDKVRALARLRGRLKALGRGSRVTHYADQDSWVYRMGGCGDGAGIADVIVVINAADSARTVPVPPGAYLDEIGGGDVSGGDVSLAARSFLILTPR